MSEDLGLEFAQKILEWPGAERRMPGEIRRMDPHVHDELHRFCENSLDEVVAVVGMWCKANKKAFSFGMTEHGDYEAAVYDSDGFKIEIFRKDPCKALMAACLFALEKMNGTEPA